jgi:hypothetical protein
MPDPNKALAKGPSIHGSRDNGGRQLAFEDLEAAVAEVEAQKAAQAPGGGDARRKLPTAKRNRGNLPADLPRIEEVIEPANVECPCCCGRLHRIGEDRTERLDIIPAQLWVIATVRPKYACRTCADGVIQAPAPAHLVEGGLPTEALIAHAHQRRESGKHSSRDPAR